MKRKINYDDYCPQDFVEKYEEKYSIKYSFRFDKIRSSTIINIILDAKWREISTWFDWMYRTPKLVEYVWEEDENWDEEKFIASVPKKTESEQAKKVTWISSKGEVV